MIDLGQLEAFVAVAEHGSFSRAADSLRLAQPTVSARIQSIERDLGERVFDRPGRVVRLTEAGKAFLPFAQRSLQAYRQGVGAIDSLREASGGRLQIGTARVIGTYVLPDVLGDFRQRHPAVRISIRTGRSSDVLDAVLGGEAAIGFTRNLVHPDIESVHLFDEPLVFVAPPGHRLAGLASVAIEELVREPLILYHRDSTYYNVILAVCREAGVSPVVTMELDNIEATKRMVARGFGVSILPASSVADEKAHGALSASAIAGSEGLRLPVYAIHLRKGSIGYLVDALLSVARDRYARQAVLA